MSLQQLRTGFNEQLKGLYPDNELDHMFNLVIENLTGIDVRNNKTARFTPDGCFIKMWTEIEERLQKSEPVQYILNEAWFYDVPFFVNPSVLIPRPETEELVNWIVKEHKNGNNISILDIGTGSGCIPVTLKRKIPVADVTACDISEAALEVARKNARKYKVDIDFVQCDFLNSNSWSLLPQSDIIVSNPPYIPQKEKMLMHDNVVAYEPHQALFVDDNDPLIFYAAIADAGKHLLKPGGMIYVEIYEGLSNETLQLFESYSYRATLKKDMQGKDRMIKCELSKA